MTQTTPTSTAADSPAANDHLAYLAVYEYLRDLVGTRALKTALDRGIVDELVDGTRTTTELAGRLGGDEAGARLLIGILAASGVVEEVDDAISLTSRFRRALPFRDLLEAKLDFVGFVLLDFIDKFDHMLADPARFQREAQLFRLFDYRRSLKPSAESYAWTKVWMRLTTTLTRYEAVAALNLHDFSAHRCMLDIGGNSGEFVLRVCKAHPELRASVMDLPVVCEFAQDHVLGERERDRITFIAGSALSDPIPAGYDLISFKSMLHDWPESKVSQFLKRAVEALEPGGTLMIYERGPLDFSEGPPTVGQLPILLFARSFRSHEMYGKCLKELGLKDITVHHQRLDSPFYLLTARKGVN